MEIHRVSTYHDVEHALRITDLKQSLYDEGKILMDKVLVTLHGTNIANDARREPTFQKEFSASMKIRCFRDCSKKRSISS